MRPLPAPDPDLRACVVVPARNEEDLVAGCLRALANQINVSPAEYEVILVLDGCTDATEDRAREVVLESPELRLHFLEGPAEGAGHARRVGMETACARLLELGRKDGLISSTDADTVVAPDWLAAQFACIEQGARAIGGRIELAEDEDLPNGVAGWRAERGHRRHMDLLSEPANGEEPRYLEHWQFSGASLALTAEVYREVGGLEPRAALEDEHLERILRQRGVPIERPLSVRVTTSARLVGRAERGLSRDLALASWFRNNTYDADAFDAGELLAHKRHTVSLVLIADEDSGDLDAALEAVSAHERSGLVDEVTVVWAGSQAGYATPRASFRRTEGLMPEYGPVRGYGDVMWRAVAATEGEILVFLDDTTSPSSVPALLGPLIERAGLSLVKGFRRSSGPPEVVARSLINLHFPGLAGFVEPLSKDLAARRDLLEALPFPAGDGVTLSLLLDAFDRAGLEALAQIELDEVRSRTPPAPEAAYAVQAAGASRVAGLKDLVPGPLFLPSSEGLQTRRVPLEERPPLAGLGLTLAKTGC